MLVSGERSVKFGRQRGGWLAPKLLISGYIVANSGRHEDNNRCGDHSYAITFRGFGTR